MKYIFCNTDEVLRELKNVAVLLVHVPFKEIRLLVLLTRFYLFHENVAVLLVHVPFKEIRLLV